MVSGTSKAGNNWKKKEYVLETHDTYPRKVFFNFWGDKADQYPLEVGEEVTISFDLESREYNGRWYTDVKAWKADKGMSGAAAPAPIDDFGAGAAAPSQFGPQSDPLGTPVNESDDLPF